MSKVKRHAKKIFNSKLAWILLGLIILFMLTSAKKVPYSDTKEYQALLIKRGTDTQQVLRNVTEQYFEYEYVPYGKMACNDVPFDYTEDLTILNYVAELDDDNEMDHFMVCTVEVTNNEIESGTWRYTMSYTKEKNSVDREELQKTIAAGESYIFRWRYSHEFKPLSCTPQRLEVPMREQCDYPENAPKKRVKVVKNRTVEKIVGVDVPSEEKSLINQTIDVQDIVFVNRVFGYRQFFFLGY